MNTQSLNSNVTERKQMRLVQWSYWLSTFAEGATRIVIPLYFASMGVEITTIALMFLFYEAFGLATNMGAGFFLNRFGYRRAFLLALTLHSVASIGYLALGPTLPIVFVIAAVGVLRALRGVAKELIKTASAVYIKRLRTDHLQSHWLLGGKDSSKGLGLLIGGILLTVLGFAGSFLVLGVATLLALAITHRLLTDIREERRVSYRGFGKVSPQMARLAVARATLYAGRDLWLVLAIPVFLASIGVSQISIGAILAAGLVTFGITQPAMGWLIKKRIVWRGRVIKHPWLYENVLPMSGLALALVPIGMLIWSDSVLAITALIVLYNVISGLATTPHNDLHLRFAKDERASVDVAFYKTVAQIGKVLAVVASGLLYDAYGIAGCLVASSSCLTVSAAMGVWITREARHSPQAQKFLRKYVLQRA